ncbi:MAG TPA: hypothetical protein VMH26_02845 [Burkholderiales bacterium]|nr:hypothetical protein [Burkholderiales bacterium]
MLDTALFDWILIGGLALFAIGLAYFVILGVRAIYRDARRTASEAGHRRVAASVRALLRMAVWALMFGAYYLLVYVLGRRLGWQAVLPSAVGLVAMIWALLQADRLLTIRPDAVRRQFGIGAAIAVVLAVFVSAIWLAA